MGLFGKKKPAGPRVKVRIKLAGFIDNRMVASEFELEAPDQATLKELFALADKSGKVPSGSFKKIFALPRPPTVLHNGENVDAPAELGRRVSGGDEIAVMTPLGGG